ncbi:MAG TPA: gamma-glutamyltransferase [Steroidobacteraceae bacterium]
MRFLTLLVAFVLVSCTHVEQPAASGTRAGVATVAAANPLAVEAGLEVLRKGGNAVDAAVAVQAMLGLVEPQSSGIAGGAFLVHLDAQTGEITVLNGREKAPAGATPTMFLDESGRPLPFRQAIWSGRSTGVPGVMKMLEQAHGKLGKLPWKDLFEPAIRTASEGFVVSPRLARFVKLGFRPETPDIKTLFSRPDGSPLQAGDTFRNPDYARTLTRLANEGAKVLYEGEIAAAIVKRTREPPLPGTMTLEDLAAYEPEWVDPICGSFRVYRICVPPPPSSGVSLLQMLAILDQTDIAERGPDDAHAWFLFAEASRLMYADRDRYVADPNFVPVPVSGMLKPEYIRQRAQLIGERAGPAPEPGSLDGVVRAADATTEVEGTSHFVVVDAEGDVVTMTTTVESFFGSGRVVAGFVLNNQLTDFSFQPVDAYGPVANAVAGGKRPRSSMSPLLVFDQDGRFFAALGSPGGSAILAYNAKTLVGLLAWNLSMQEAIDLPNVFARGDEFYGEVSKFPAHVLEGLRARGIDLKAGRGEESGLHGVVRRPDGRYEGGADKRREGVVGQLSAAD